MNSRLVTYLIIVVSLSLQLFTIINTEYFHDEMVVPVTWSSQITSPVTPHFKMSKLFNSPQYDCSVSNHIKMNIRNREQHQLSPLYNVTLCYILKLFKSDKPIKHGRVFNCFLFLIFAYLVLLSPWKPENILIRLILINLPVVNYSFIFVRQYPFLITLITLSYLLHQKTKTKYRYLINSVSILSHPIGLAHSIFQELLLRINKIQLKAVIIAFSSLTFLTILARLLAKNMPHMHFIIQHKHSFIEATLIRLQTAYYFLVGHFFDIRIIYGDYHIIKWGFITSLIASVLTFIYFHRGNKIILLSLGCCFLILLAIPYQLLIHFRYFSFFIIPIVLIILPKILQRKHLILLVVITFSYRVYASNQKYQYVYDNGWYLTKKIFQYIDSNPDKKINIGVHLYNNRIGPHHFPNVTAIYFKSPKKINLFFYRDLNNLQEKINGREILLYTSLDYKECNTAIKERYRVCIINPSLE
jgi:hypothetical protein